MMGRNLRVWGTVAVLAIFVGLGYWQFREMDGDDLSASYIACRLLAHGETEHLYSYDPNDFAAVGEDEAWQSEADRGGYESYLHPYVQTPLWAYSLQPLCRGVLFEGFKRWFLAVEMLSFAGILWVVAWYWARDLLTPWAMAAVALALWFSQPFLYAMHLMQTHVIYLLLAIAALLLAERGRGGWAGVLLALAAAVKLTPGVLVVYWVVKGRWKAAASTILWSGVLWVAAIALTGRQAMAAYLADVHRISRILLVAMNNQSLAAWWMGRVYPAEVMHFKMLALPETVRVGSTMLMVGCAALGGWLDRRRGTGVPLGGMLALVAATVFAPISWTHYAVVLVAPLMMLVQEARKMEGGLQRWVIAGGVVVIAGLNFRPVALDVAIAWAGQRGVVRSEFYAEMLCMVVLGMVCAMNARQTRCADRLSTPPPVTEDGCG